jgi:hypothetical protein
MKISKFNYISTFSAKTNDVEGRFLWIVSADDKSLADESK